MKYKDYIFVSFLTIAATTQAQQTITISPLDKTRIQVEYKLPQHCTSAKLQERYEGRAPSLRKDWQAMDKCSSLTDGDTLTIPKGCRSSSFAVPMSSAFIDRVEPLAYPMGDPGVRVHTGTFGLTDKCGDTTWIFKSPKGSVVDESGIYPKRFKASLAEKNYLNYTGVYLSYKPLKSNIKQIFTKTVPPELKVTLTEGEKLLSNYYRTTYPKISFTSPFLLVDNIKQNGFGVQGEVTSPHMIRIGYVNWSPEKINDTREVQAHEYAHLLQPTRREFTSPFFHEGGAEFISLKASYDLGWISKTVLSEKISAAVQNCIALSGNKKWDEIKHDFGRAPYDCGLAMHVLALASRQQPDSSEQTLEKYYVSQLDDTHFAKFIECGNRQECTPVFSNELIGNTKSFASTLIASLNQLKLVTQQSYTNPKDSYHRASGAAFASLMSEDCKGADFYTQQNHFQTGEMLNCNSIPKKTTITTVNGINYFTDPDAAIEAQNKGCSTVHEVLLDNDQQIKISVPCKNAISKTYYTIDIDRLLLLLNQRAVQ